MNFLKKNWGNIVFFGFIILLFIPQTGMPIRVFVNRLIAFSPSEVKAEEVVTISDYEWNLQSLDGDKVNLVQSEGKVVVINLWATWCPPCVAEMPSLQKLFDRYGDRVDFYFVSSESDEKLRAFLQKKAYNLPVFIERSAAPEGVMSRTLPTTYIISKHGEIIVDKSGAANWNSKKVYAILDKLLN